jgi:hypothetical protein
MKFVFSISGAKVGETAGLGVDDLGFVTFDLLKPFPPGRTIGCNQCNL